MLSLNSLASVSSLISKPELDLVQEHRTKRLQKRKDFRGVILKKANDTKNWGFQLNSLD